MQSTHQIGLLQADRAWLVQGVQKISMEICMADVAAVEIGSLDIPTRSSQIAQIHLFGRGGIEYPRRQSSVSDCMSTCRRVGSDQV